MTSLTKICALLVLGFMSSVSAQINSTTSISSQIGTTSATATTRPTANPNAAGNTTTSGYRTTIILPPLVQCQYSTWTFTANPAGLPKYLGFFPANSNTWIETLSLPDAYTNLTSGTFQWLVDFPVGLSVSAMFYVLTPDGIVPTGGSATTTAGQILSGTTSSCLAGNEGQNTASILSYASQLNPSFVYTPPGSAATAGTNSVKDPSSSNSNLGGIIGGAVGGVAAILAIGLILLFLRGRHAKKRAQEGTDAYPIYSEKPYSTRTGYNGPNSAYGPGSVSGTPASSPPPGTFYTTDEYGHTILMALPNQGPMQDVMQPQTPPASAGLPRQTAATGTLPEPMGDDSASVRPSRSQRDIQRANSAGNSEMNQNFHQSHAQPDPFTPAHEHQTIITHSEQVELDDPNSFSPQRRS